LFIKFIFYSSNVLFVLPFFIKKIFFFFHLYLIWYIFKFLGIVFNYLDGPNYYYYYYYKQQNRYYFGSSQLVFLGSVVNWHKDPPSEQTPHRPDHVVPIMTRQLISSLKFEGNMSLCGLSYTFFLQRRQSFTSEWWARKIWLFLRSKYN
jgi:hypothetical protein